MGFLDKRKVKKAIAAVIEDPERRKLDTTQAVLTLKGALEDAIPEMLALLNTPKPPKGIIHVLISFLDDETYPLFLQGLVSGDQHITSATANILASPGRFDANMLLDLYDEKEIPKAVLGRILVAHKDKIRLPRVMRLLRSPSKEVRTSLFRLIDQAASYNNLHQVIELVKSDDPALRLSIAHILKRFSTESVRNTLLALLKDANKQVRISALEGLAEIKVPVEIGPIIELLKDPDITVQSKAVDVLVMRDEKGATPHLVNLLQDESEYIRRAAVEVLNEVADVTAIKDLMKALRDHDWWVRVRASDALGKIGGPKVIEAVLMLIKDEDEFIRRFAVEILNTTNDERAVQYLLDALNDPDWWVRERAIDALGSMGDKRAVKPLCEMMKSDVEARPAAIKALGELGDPKAVPIIAAYMEQGDNAVRKPALEALAKLASGDDLKQVEEAIDKIRDGSDPEIKNRADETMATIMARLNDATRVASSGPSASQSLLQPDVALSGGKHPTDETPTDPEQERAPAKRASTAQKALLDASELEPGEVLDNRYEVLRHIGRGAFGDVVLVKDIMVDEEIILKFLHHNLTADKDVINRFVHELRYARKITHENVIRIFDFMTIGGAYAMTMEYFDSHSIGAELKKGLFDRRRAYKIILDVCKAMLVAHQANVVHRDLKPGNILINDDGLVKVVDFGLAAAASHTDSRLTKTGVILGTPTYMAPEQVRDGKIDPRTDIYSLGIVMYELFSGRPPYQASDPMAILFQHIEGKPTPPSELNAKIQAPLEACILKAMAVAPEDRYQSMAKLGRDVQKIAKAEFSK